ncbi:MAG TPA: glycogen synthase GlgA [Candidatus Acidoferrales bacterium]
MRILFAASEATPFAKTGGLADVVGALPKALARLGHEVAVVLPRYRGMQGQPVLIRSLTIPMGSTLRFPGVVDGGKADRVQFFFIDDPQYFDRDQLYQTSAGDYPDNAARFALLSRAVIELIKRLVRPDVLHCHDWQTALVPTLMHSLYQEDPALEGLPVVLTLHNLGYQGLFPKSCLADLGLPESLFRIDALEFWGQVNYLKGGFLFSDAITTVSKTYAAEIQTEEHGYGLEGVIRSRSGSLTGILNGVDYTDWDPLLDRYIRSNYDSDSLEKKLICKRDLLESFGLPADDLGRPLIGIVSRLTRQKGFDLVADVADRLVRFDLQIVALGTGEPAYEEMFREMARLYPNKIAVRIAYDNALAHKIEAGADIFLMPSRYEPCGLNQIYSLKYGTIPVVRATGGLQDTIEPFDPATGQGTGFKFRKYSGQALLDCLALALNLYRDPRAWRQLQLNAMSRDFSWQRSAEQYARLYESLRTARIVAASPSSNV